MMYVATLICMAIMPFASSRMIHNYMTPDEVMGIFHTTHDKVPEYEVVPVLHSLNNMHYDGMVEMQFKAFEHDINLYLNPTEGHLVGEDTPLWTARSDPKSPEGIRYSLQYKALQDIGTPVQDVKAGAALLMTPDSKNRTIFDGYLPSDMVIRSVPERLLENIMYGDNGLYEPQFSQNAGDKNDLVYTYHHIVYKKPPTKHNFYMTNPLGGYRQAPDVVYPEILVVVDYNLYRMLGRNMDQAKRYIVAFWNAVDLRYRLLTNPKIRLNVAGIIVALDMNGIPYLENSRVDVAMVDADRALRGMADYFYRETRFPKKFYDIVLAMTQMDLCNMIFEDICDPSTLGYAYVAGACNRNHTKLSSEAVGLAEDNGGFSGIIPAAHELGHLIGARHDGNPKDGTDCSPYDGFLMTSGLMLGENGFTWSNCSINAFYRFLNEDRARCLYNEPPPTKKQVKRLLPGKLMSLDDQCKKVYGTGACNKESPTICYRLDCEFPGSGGLCRAVAPAAEGSPCGPDLICLNGKCVLEGTETKDYGAKLLNTFSMKFIPQGIKPYNADQ